MENETSSFAGELSLAVLVTILFAALAMGCIIVGANATGCDPSGSHCL